MDDLKAALNDIRTMREHLARSAPFRFYGPVAVGLTGLMAVGAGLLQAVAMPVPHPVGYLTLWTGTAVLAGATIAADVIWRARRAPCGLADDMVRDAACQLLPAGAVGALLTMVIAQAAPQALWMLPGLWQIILALGVFSACRALPAAMQLVGFWYAGSGLVCLAFGQGAGALSPSEMAGPFGGGEALAALLLYLVGGRDEPVG